MLEAELKVPPLADHSTPMGSLVVAMTERVWLTARLPRFGEIVTLIPCTPAITVIVAVAVLLLLLTEVAVSVTVAGEGTLAGAVYVIATPEPLAADDKTPHVAPEQPVPASDQVTPPFCLSFWTVAVKFWFPPFA